jgi:hypothetical protein
MMQSQSAFQHDEVSMPLILPRQSDIRMPMLNEETTFTALFVLEDDVPLSVSSRYYAQFPVLLLNFLDDQRGSRTGAQEKSHP